MSLQGPNAEQSTEYIGSPTWVLSRALDRLQLNPRDFVFVDLGSGKGRVILRAATRPFRRVEGVEFSEPLHRVALRNIDKARAAGALRAPVVAHNSVMDATAFDPPREPLVIYSFNPFGKKIMQRFVERLVALFAGASARLLFHLSQPAMPAVHQRGRLRTGTKLATPDGYRQVDLSLAAGDLSLSPKRRTRSRPRPGTPDRRRLAAAFLPRAPLP